MIHHVFRIHIRTSIYLRVGAAPVLYLKPSGKNKVYCIEKFHARNNISQPVWMEAYKQNETKVSCLFGEHLLTKYPHNPVGLVEDPKTAIYGTLYFGGPEQPKNLLWLGKDLTDYLITMDWHAFRKREGSVAASNLTSSDVDLASAKSETSERPKTTIFHPPKSEPNLRFTNTAKKERDIINAPDNWTTQIKELGQFFKQIQPTDQTIRLNSSSRISNLQLFVENHLKTIRRNNGNRTYLPYLHRLQEMRQTLVPANSEPHDCAINENH